VAALFALSLFFAPLFTIVPPHAYGIALIMIGSFMIKPITLINFDDPSELIPSFLTIVLMVFTYNIGIGMTAGMITYVLIKTCTGRSGEVKTGMWALALLSVTLFVFLPKT
jgi:AGZA family xanthine/uracil permease-like MFS transporter